jgi:hypothetical protein
MRFRAASVSMVLSEGCPSSPARRPTGRRGRPARRRRSSSNRRGWARRRPGEGAERSWRRRRLRRQLGPGGPGHPRHPLEGRRGRQRRRSRRSAGIRRFGRLRREQPPRRLRAAVRRAGTNLPLPLGSQAHDRAEGAERPAGAGGRARPQRDQRAPPDRRHAAPRGPEAGRALVASRQGDAPSRPPRHTRTNAWSINGDGVVSGWSREQPDADGENKPRALGSLPPAGSSP